MHWFGACIRFIKHTQNIMRNTENKHWQRESVAETSEHHPYHLIIKCCNFIYRFDFPTSLGVFLDCFAPFFSFYSVRFEHRNAHCIDITQPWYNAYLCSILWWTKFYEGNECNPIVDLEILLSSEGLLSVI